MRKPLSKALHQWLQQLIRVKRGRASNETAPGDKHVICWALRTTCCCLADFTLCSVTLLSGLLFWSQTFGWSVLDSVQTRRRRLRSDFIYLPSACFFNLTRPEYFYYLCPACRSALHLSMPYLTHPIYFKRLASTRRCCICCSSFFKLYFLLCEQVSWSFQQVPFRLLRSFRWS